MKNLKTFKIFESINKISFNKDEIFQGYIICALWVNEYDDYDEDDFTADEINELKNDVDIFIKKTLLILSNITSNNNNIVNIINNLDNYSIGHDLWLTRNGHGSGFWDKHEFDIEFQNSTEATDKELYTLKNYNLGVVLSKVSTDMGEKDLWFEKPYIDEKTKQFNI